MACLEPSGPERCRLDSSTSPSKCTRPCGTAGRDSGCLHAKDKSPINFERICQKDGKPVAWNDLVKGYEYQKGRFVVLTKEDIAAAALEKTRRIDILDFVGASRSTIATSTNRTT